METTPARQAAALMQRKTPQVSRRPIRLIEGAHLYASVCFFVFGLFYWFLVHSAYMLVTNSLFGALCTLNWFVYRRVKKDLPLATTFMTIVYLGLINAVVHLGVHDSPLIYWGLSIAVAAAFIFSVWGTIVWVALCIAFFPLTLILKRTWLAHRAISLNTFQTAFLNEASYFGILLFLGYTLYLFQLKLKGALQGMEQNEEKYRTLVETAQEGIAVSDTQNRLAYLNERFAKMFGYTKDEMLGHHLTEFMNPKSRTEFLKRFEDRRTGKHESYELSYPHRDGKTVVHVLISARPIFDHRGDFGGVFAVVTDVTKLKQTEEALRKSQRDLTYAQHIGHMGSWVRDLRTNEIRLSEENRQLFGMEQGAVVNLESFINLIHVDDREPVKAALSRTLQLGQPYSADYRICRPDGVEVAIHAEGALTRDSDGIAVELAGTVQDVTELRQQQKERAEILAREKLARAEAERANKTKDLFLATLSHELRTPMTAILGWTQLIRAGKVSPAQSQKGFEIIEQSAQQQAQLINDLLDISRIIAGKLSIETQPVLAVGVVESVIESFGATIAEKQVEILRDFDPSVTSVLADPARLRQVLWNLLGNAIKFSHAGGKIAVRLRRTGTFCEISVSDDGVGIEPDFLPYIFDRFSQENSSSTRNYSGLGLGLSISSNIAKMMGGRLWAESRGKGQGASFTFTLPLSEWTNSSTKPNVNQPAIKSIEGLRILLVDDDSVVREVLSQLLTSFGASVKPAASAREAIALLGEFKPNLLISDLAMPEEDGYELIRRIRERTPENGGKIHAIAVTAYAGAEDKMRALSSGFQGYLAKPVDANALQQTIAEVAKQRDERTTPS